VTIQSCYAGRVDNDSSEEFGPYVVYEQLGIGGMATVHRAELTSLAGVRKEVALKRLLRHLSTNRQLVDSFVNEARLASKLQHENIAQTYDLGKVGDTYFISMEYVPGPTLEQVMKHCRAAAGAIPLAVTLGILGQICEALEYAHARVDDETGLPLNIVHRDISPANVILSNTGCMKLIDFGIAKVENSNVRTATGVIKGKLNYLAPEHILGKLDARADLFTLGIMAHELLTGRPLFEGRDDFEGYVQILEMPIQRPSRWSPECPHDLDDIVLTALQRNPDLRWRSAGAMGTALANVAREHGAIATRPEIVAWVQWAFSQKPRTSSPHLEHVIETLGQPTRIDLPLTARQRDELADPDRPIHTMVGVGNAGTPSQRMAAMRAPTIAPAALWQPGSVSHLVHPPPMSAPPAKLPPAPPRSLAELAGGVAPTDPSPGGIPRALADDESGVVIVPPAATGGSLRFLLITLLIIVIGGAAGIGVAAYVFELELPFIGRLG